MDNLSDIDSSYISVVIVFEKEEETADMKVSLEHFFPSSNICKSVEVS